MYAHNILLKRSCGEVNRGTVVLVEHAQQRWSSSVVSGVDILVRNDQVASTLQGQAVEVLVHADVHLPA